MPQMAPILWLNLLIFFMLSLLFFFVMNFFTKTSFKMNKLPKKILIQEKLWKW